MAGIAIETTLSGNGKRIEAANPDFGGGTLILTTNRRVIVPAFANVEDIIKCVIGLRSSGGAAPSTLKSVAVSFQELIGTVTMTIASPGVVTLNSHGFVGGEVISFTTTGALPTGLSINTNYYVLAASITANTFRVSLTNGGAAINTSGSQSGTHSLHRERRNTAMTGNAVANSVANPGGGWQVPYVWTGYTMDTTANKWSFLIYNSTTAEANSWELITSDATNPSYIAIGNHDQALKSGVVTLDNGTPCTVNYTSHGFSGGETFTFATNDALPTGITAGLQYFVLAAGITANTFQFSLTSGGAAVATTGLTFTVTIASPAVVTRTAHGFIGGELMRFTTTSALPTGLAINTDYYVLAAGLTANTFQLATTPNGTAINTSGSQSGTHTFYRSGFTMVALDWAVITAPVTVDRHMAFRDTFGTGVTTRSWSVIMCRNTTPTPTNVAMLIWDNATYKVSFQGAVLEGAHAGHRIGTSSVRLSDLEIIWTAPTTTGGISGFMHGAGGSSGSVPRKMSGFAYGVRPTTFRWELSADAATGQPVVVLVDATGLAVGDIVFLGGIKAITSVDTAPASVIAISGNNVTLSRNLGGSASRADGVYLCKLNGYGIKMIGCPTIATISYMRGASNVVYDGVQCINYGIKTVSGENSVIAGIGNGDDSANVIAQAVQYCSFWDRDIATGNVLSVPEQGLTHQFNNYFRSSCEIAALTGTSGSSVNSDNEVVFPRDNDCFFNITNMVMQRNNFYVVGVSLQGVGATITDNNLWGRVTSGFLITGASQVIAANNKYNYLGTAWQANGNVSDWRETDSEFGQIGANTVDIGFTAGIQYTEVYFISPTGNLTIPTTNQTSIVPGSKITITDYNNVAGDDRNWYYWGEMVSTGWGLGDTTVFRNGDFQAANAAGQKAMKFTLRVTTPAVVYTDGDGKTLIGNSSGLECKAIMYTKIINSAFWAGVNTPPTHRLTYDIVTVVDKVSALNTNAQSLLHNYTPATSIEAVRLDLVAGSDASPSNTQFYAGRVVSEGGKGVVIDTQNLGSWTNGKPNATFRTFPANSNLLDDILAGHTNVGTVGEAVNLINIIYRIIREIRDILGI